MTEKKCTFRIVKDIQKDAWNWWEACNKSSHGMDWKTKAPQDALINIEGKTQEVANEFLIPYLEAKYKEESDSLESFMKKSVKIFDQQGDEACALIEEKMGKPLYRKDFTFIITTFPRGPYNIENGTIWVYPKWSNPMGTFLHELCHFQFIYHWRNRNDSPVASLTYSQFDYLKESLTIILDEDFYPFIERPDKGYQIHQDFRVELKEHWKKYGNFDELVNFGVSRISEYTK
jgi:hypothetical protein